MNLREMAIYFAGQSHKDQKYGENFYFYHLNKVDLVLKWAGFDESSVERIVAWLHDCMEDCEVAFKIIEKHFGVEVANVVWAVSNEPGENRKERALKTYPKIRRSSHSLAVKLADRIANVEHSLINNTYQARMYAQEHHLFVMELGGVFADERMIKLWERYFDAMEKIIMDYNIVLD